MNRLAWTAAAVAAAALATACATGPAGGGRMGFFVTSVGKGDGANLGGLAGADAHCQQLATAAGAGGRTWRAYLSVPGRFPGQPTHPGGLAFGEPCRVSIFSVARHRRRVGAGLPGAQRPGGRWRRRGALDAPTPGQALQEIAHEHGRIESPDMSRRRQSGRR